MSVEYYYDKPNPVDLDQLLVDISASEMTDKAIEYARWDAEPISPKEELTTVWPVALSSGDKTILDGIVAAI